MPQRKNKTKKARLNYRKILLFTLALTSFVSIFYIYNNGESELKNKVASNVDTKKTFYPTQYSDSHITQNAISSDVKFKNITFAPNNSMLANSISFIQKNESSTNIRDQENGTWLWTPVLEITPKYRDSIISGAIKNGIKNIYISIDSYLDIYIMPDGKEKTSKKQFFDQVVNDFIALANKNGITVDAEAGWRNWAEEGHSYKAIATLSYAVKFNKSHVNKFRGFQYDVEPYLLESYKNNKKVVLTNFLNLISQSVSFLNNSDLELSVVIPEFYDGIDGNTPSFSYRGVKGYTTDHLLGILDRRDSSSIIVMSYRNWSLGKDGSIDISKNEITTGDKHKTKVIIAQETGDVEPSYITFYNTNKKYYKKQTADILNAFSLNKSFGGLAVHYINAFMDLK